MQLFSRGAGAIVLAIACARPAAAAVFTEIGDASDQAATAQTAFGSGPLDMIIGEISSINDADIFRIRITSPASFSASTANVDTPMDTQLFLFTTIGIGIAFNDDSGDVRAVLPLGNSLYSSLTSGEYLLAISLFNTDPQSAGGDIFPDDPSGVHGPTGPGGGSALSGWLNSGSTSGLPTSGPYQINLTGAEFVASPNAAPVPEPSSLLGLTVAGMLGLASSVRRRRKNWHLIGNE